MRSVSLTRRRSRRSTPLVPKRSSWYGVFQGHRKFDLFAECDERIRGSQRRLVSQIYSMESLRDLEMYIDDAVAHFTRKMQDRVGQNINMGLFVQLFAFDVIGEETFSKRFGFMEMGTSLSSLKT